MAVLEKIRVKFGILITVLVALALLSFIIDPQTLRSAFEMFSKDNEVGEMNGKAVTYKNFYEQLDNYTKIAEMTGQATNDEQAQASLRDMAWQGIFDEQVFLPKAEKAGVAVSDAEMFDLTQGSAISPVLTQQGFFTDANGNFSREALSQFVQSIDNDASGQSAAFWNFLEESVYKNQIFSKYASLLDASVVKNDVEKERLISENNIISDVDFVMIPVGFAADSTIKVTSEEIRSYYNDHKKMMQQPANRDIEYVMFEVVPSQADIDATGEEFNELYEEFKTAENLKNFVTLNSDTKWSTYYYKESELESVPEFKELAFGSAAEISPVVKDELRFSAARVADTKVMSDSVKVSYAICALSDGARIDSLMNVARKGDLDAFQEIGWIDQNFALQSGIPEAEKLFASTDKVVKVVSESQQVAFLFHVADRTKAIKKVQLATLVKNVLASDETYRDFLMKATELSDKADGKYEKFAQVCKDEDLPVIPMTNVLESARRIGAVDNAREVIRWVFDKKTKAGDVSDVIIVDNKYYFVTAVTKTRKEGRIALADVASDIKTILEGEKRIEARKAEVEGKIAGCTTMEQIAEALGTTVSHQSGISFGSQNQQLDPKFIGAIAAAEPGKVTGPVAGQIGVFVFQVLDNQNGSFFTASDVKTQAARTAQYYNSMLQSVMMKEADVKDNRARFY